MYIVGTAWSHFAGSPTFHKMALQTQMDVGSSAITLTGKALALFRAATMDDVQPAAFLAAEALGDIMMVDPSLIGKAVDTLGGNKSYRLENLKIQLGLSATGIPSQKRQSVSATRTFLLISAFCSAQRPGVLAELLYQMLSYSKRLDFIAVSCFQLESLIHSVEGHSVSLLSKENVEKHILDPITQRLISTTHSRLLVFFDEIIPNEASQILCRVFDALRDTAVKNLKISGSRFGAWLVSTLCWLCPCETTVFNKAGLVIWGTSPNKVSIVIDGEDEDHWKFEYWYVTGELSDLFRFGDTLPIIHGQSHPPYPRQLVYSLLSTHWPLTPLTKDELHVIGILAYGIISAGYEHIVPVEPESLSRNASCRLRDVCSVSFLERLPETFENLGWPSISNLVLEEARCISKYFGEQRFRYSSGEPISCDWDAALIDLDDKYLDGRLGTKNKSQIVNGDIMHFALHIAHVLLLGATQKRYLEVSAFPAPGLSREKGTAKMKSSWLLDPLLSVPDCTVSAYDYFDRSLHFSICDPITMVPPTHGGPRRYSVLALASRGQVAVAQGLLEPPRTPAESFQITVTPGRLLWRDDRYERLEDSHTPLFPLNNVKPTPRRLNLSSYSKFSLRDSLGHKTSIMVSRDSKKPYLCAVHNWEMIYRYGRLC